MPTRIARLLPLLLFCLPAAGQTKVFAHFTLIDGNGGPALPDSAMEVTDGRIAWIGPAATLRRPQGAAFDLRGQYVMPGIVNLHGHVGNVIDLAQNPGFFTRENIEKDLRTYASYGVTTVLSLGTDQDLIFKIRDEQRAGRPSMARVYTAGRGFTVKDGYGGLPSVTYSLGGSAEIPADIAALAAKQVDFVKMWVDDHLGRTKKMPFEMAQAIIDNAHSKHLRVAAHIFYLDDAKRLANAGLDAFAHSVRDQPVDAELIDAMKKRGVWQAAATLSRELSTFVYAQPPDFLTEPFFTRAVSSKTLAVLNSPEYRKRISADPDLDKLPRFLKTAQQNLKRLADAGVKYGLGTDAGPPGRFPGFFEHLEMELMVEAGLTPSQVITAATKSGAEFLRAADLGALEKGKWADFVALERNPLDNIHNARTIRAVYIAGERVDRN